MAVTGNKREHVSGVAVANVNGTKKAKKYIDIHSLFTVTKPFSARALSRSGKKQIVETSPGSKCIVLDIDGDASRRRVSLVRPENARNARPNVKSNRGVADVSTVVDVAEDDDELYDDVDNDVQEVLTRASWRQADTARDKREGVGGRSGAHRVNAANAVNATESDGDGEEADEAEDEEEQQEVEDEEEEEHENAGLDKLYCEVCGRQDGDDGMLLCDGRGCNRGYHLWCLRPILVAVPLGQWLCPDCRHPTKIREFPLVQKSIVDFFRIQHAPGLAPEKTPDAVRGRSSAGAGTSSMDSRSSVGVCNARAVGSGSCRNPSASSSGALSFRTKRGSITIDTCLESAVTDTNDCSLATEADTCASPTNPCCSGLCSSSSNNRSTSRSSSSGRGRRRQTRIKLSRKLFPHRPVQDPERRLAQLQSLATALTAIGARFVGGLEYPFKSVPRGMNEPGREVGGMQVLSRENVTILQRCEEMWRNGEPPPLIVKHDPSQGFVVEADAPIADRTIVTEYGGVVDTMARRRHDPCDAMMGLLFTGQDKTDLVICPDQAANFARFISGINNHTKEGRRKANLRCVRFSVNGEARALLIANRRIAQGERLYYDYNRLVHEYPTMHFE